MPRVVPSLACARTESSESGRKLFEVITMVLEWNHIWEEIKSTYYTINQSQTPTFVYYQ